MPCLRRLRCNLLSFLFAAGLATGAPALAAGQTAAPAPVSAPAPAPAPLSIADALKWDTVTGLRISPDGKQIAGVIQKRAAAGVVIYDTATLVPHLLVNDSPTLSSAASVHWFDNRYLVVSSSRRGDDLVDVSSKHFIDAGSEFIRKLEPDSAGHARFLYFSDGKSYRYDMVTKERQQMDRSPPERPLVGWLSDHAGVARVATTLDTAFFSDETRRTHWYRESEKHPWEKLASFDFLDDGWETVSFSRDDKSLIVASRQGRDTFAYFRYDLKERKLAEMMAGHPTQDIYANFQTVDVDPKFALTAGIKTEIKWFTAAGDALQRGVDLALPDRINLIQGDPQGQVLVYSYNDRDPGRWLVLDVPSGVMRLVAARKPEIDIEKMLPKQIVEYKARDGLMIPAYLTVPDSTGPGPAVIYIHGGPETRDGWNWDPEVQMMASRGYTVFQPQFRGSGGFGKRYTEAGYGQWGAAMQDDITDGVVWLVEHGYADPDRICIYGASYGGYAALWGLAKTSTLYRCGASFAGVSDLQGLRTDRSDTNYRATGRLLLNRMFGPGPIDKQALDRVSPLKNAAYFRAPVLIAHGEWDVRVRIDHSEKMVDALRDKGKQVEWLRLDEEGHGLYHERNQQRFYQALFKFFDKHIGRPSPAVVKKN